MKTTVWSLFGWILLGWLVQPLEGLSAPGSAELIKAKQASEAKGYIFEMSHDEIVAKAKKEGQLLVLSGLDSLSRIREAFVKKYPFIETQVAEIGGRAAAVRFLREIKAGAVDEWDVISVTSDLYNQYLPYLKKFDVYGMAKKGVLGMPAGMVDPKNRNVVGNTSSVSVVSFNQSLISPEKVPNRWEDFLRPEYKGRKFVVDIRPHHYTAMVPLNGLEWVLDYCRKIASQRPIWVRGQTSALTAMAAGEYALHAAVNYHSTVRVQRRDPTGNLQYRLIEPVPVRISATEGILGTAEHPYAALLWLEFQASPEGQKIIDQYEPVKSSVYATGSSVEKLIRGKRVSVLDWNTFHNKEKWAELIIEAFGFPKAERIQRR